MRIERIAMLALLLAFAFFASPAVAENPCKAASGEGAVLLADSAPGVSDTRRGGGDESGIGGTGHSGGDESGFGGTGYQGGDESGIGGTGILGTITAFGSICVNELRIHYDEKTPIEIDGEAVDADALALGQVVAVVATGRGDEVEAVRVEIHSALVGPVSRIDRGAGLLYVMGAPVMLDAELLAQNGDLRVGARVAVSGLRRADGFVVASRIANADDDPNDRVSGVARRSAAGPAEIGGVRTQAHDDLGGIAEGERANATGHYDAAAGVFQVETLSNAPLLDPHTAHLSLEGYLQPGLAAGGLSVGGIPLDRESVDRIAKPAWRDLRVRVTGTRDPMGRLHVERVHRVEPPRAIRDLRPVARRRRGDAAKPEASPAPEERVRPKRPLIDRLREPPPRPPRIDRPPKIDRPTAIDSAVRLRRLQRLRR